MELSVGKINILKKQPINRRVMLALLGPLMGSVYFFGWRCLFITAWCAGVGYLVEYIFTRNRKEPVTEGVFVTSTIFALIMPPTISLHVATIGTVFAVMFAKEVFGGFARNIFNPAMAGRCFVYICFPIALTSTWAPPAEGPWGALEQWTTVPTTDAITTATPMAYLKAGNLVIDDGSNPQAVDSIPLAIDPDQTVHVKRSALLLSLLFGRISGTAGVTSAILILIGGVYLYYTKTASRTIILSLVISYAVLNQVLFWFGVDPVSGAMPALLGGGFLFGAFFMATDPISAPRTEEAKIFYGILIALCTVVIRNFSIFNGGLMFSILIGNMFAPILDYAVKAYKDSREARGGQ